MDYLISRYISAVDMLPQRLRTAAFALPERLQAEGEEFRLRAGRRPSLLLPEGELPLDAPAVTPQDLTETAARVSGGSLHSVADQLSSGFITGRHGHRLGLCGRAAMEGDSCVTIRDFSSANLRIAKEVQGAADSLFPAVLDGELRSTLILSPPGVGKTTLLRDLVRQVSDAGLRVSVADERGELAACADGLPGFDLGGCTDVLTGAPKGSGALTLLRAMNPQAVAMDEITDPADLDAVARISGCGVAVFATVHGSSLSEIRRRPGFDRILPLFSQAALITRREGRRWVTLLDPADAE